MMPASSVVVFPLPGGPWTTRNCLESRFWIFWVARSCCAFSWSAYPGIESGAYFYVRVCADASSESAEKNDWINHSPCSPTHVFASRALITCVLYL